jgi:hypothetical protein
MHQASSTGQYALRITHYDYNNNTILCLTLLYDVFMTANVPNHDNFMTVLR